MKDEWIWKTLDQTANADEESAVGQWVHEGNEELLHEMEAFDRDMVHRYTYPLSDSFLERLTQNVIRELQIPGLKINFLPILFFLVLSALVLLSYFVFRQEVVVDVSSWLYHYKSYMLAITALSFGLLFLLGIDHLLQLSKRRLSARH